MDQHRKLSELLHKECDLHNKLLQLENSKTDVLVKGDVNRLDELMKAEQPIMMECSYLERRRQELQDSMGLGTVTLREIVESCDSEEKEELAQVFADLTRVVEMLKKVNGTNMAVLASRMETLTYINSMLGIEEKQPTYQRP